MAVVYVVSRSSDERFALNAGNVIDISSNLLDPVGTARNIAYDYTTTEGETAFIWRVDMSLQGSTKVEKKVVYVPAE